MGMDKDLYLSITAPINEGNSGGPLFNMDGHVVGINSAKLTDVSRVAFAIPSQQLAMVLDALYKNREFIVPDLGFKWSPGSSNLNEYMTGLPAEGGVFVREVVPGGLFGRAGVEENDILLAIDQRKISAEGQIHMEELDNDVNIHGMLTRKLIGSDLVISVYRGDVNASALHELSTKYVMTDKPAVKKYQEPIVDRPAFESVAGMVIMELSLDLAETSWTIIQMSWPSTLMGWSDLIRLASSSPM